MAGEEHAYMKVVRGSMHSIEQKTDRAQTEMDLTLFFLHLPLRVYPTQLKEPPRLVTPSRQCVNLLGEGGGSGRGAGVLVWVGLVNHFVGSTSGGVGLPNLGGFGTRAQHFQGLRQAMREHVF